MYSNLKNPAEMKIEPYFTTEINWHRPDELPEKNTIMIVLVKTKEELIFSTQFYYNTQKKFKLLEENDYTVLAWTSTRGLENIAKLAMERAVQPAGIPEIDKVLEDFFTTDVFEYIKKNN